MSKGMICVGGPKHGERLALHDRDYNLMVARPRTTGFSLTEPSAAEVAVTNTVYTREKAGIGSRSIEYLRHESMSRETGKEVLLDLVFYEAGGTLY